MKRRDFVVGAAAVAVWPGGGQAQSRRRLGVLTRAGDAQNDWFDEFKAAFEKLGWRQAQNIEIDRRWTSGESDLPGLDALAKELVSLKPDVILAHSSPVVAALQRQTSTIPIVFVSVNDPVTSGFVASLSHPGGNITGFANFEPSLAGKLIEILKEIAPNIRRVAIMYNSKSYYSTSTASFFDYASAMRQAASSHAIESIDGPIKNEADIESLIARLGNDPASGLVVIPDPYIGIGPRRALLVSLTARHRVPAIYPFSFFVTDGGLVSYGNNLPESFRQAATYVDRILKGDRPSELPVQLPTKFELVINLKTAAALGLAVPHSLIARADEVIE
jgi:putative ABC transport system substrate-binding protein